MGSYDKLISMAAEIGAQAAVAIITELMKDKNREKILNDFKKMGEMIYEIAKRTKELNE